jgi:hypothetical protein
MLAPRAMPVTRCLARKRDGVVISETYPAQISPWEMGSKWGHFFFLIFPLFSMYYFGNQYKEHLKQKNQKNTIVGVFSQDSN